MNRDQHDKELLKTLKSISVSFKNIEKSLNQIMMPRIFTTIDSDDERETEDKED